MSKRPKASMLPAVRVGSSRGVIVAFALLIALFGAMYLVGQM